MVQSSEQRRGHAQRRVETGLVVGKEAAWALQRWLRRVGVAGRVVSPAAGVKNVDALRVLKIGGCALAERGDCAEHHIWMSARQVGHPDLVVDDGIGRGEDVMQGLAVACDVQHGGPLVGVEVGEDLASLGPADLADVWRHGPGGAAPPGRFDLDDVGAEVGPQLSAVFPGHRFGQFDDADAVQCRHGLRACCAPSGSAATRAGSSSRCPSPRC
jgi:hypothetical protein